MIFSDKEDQADDMIFFSRMSRSGSALSKIQEIIKKIENDDVHPSDDMSCIIGCGRKKSMVLMPCRHQHTCGECWVLIKSYHFHKIPVECSNDSDENEMKPKCPVCKCHVDEELNVLN